MLAQLFAGLKARASTQNRNPLGLDSIVMKIIVAAAGADGWPAG